MAVNFLGFKQRPDTGKSANNTGMIKMRNHPSRLADNGINLCGFDADFIRVFYRQRCCPGQTHGFIGYYYIPIGWRPKPVDYHICQAVIGNDQRAFSQSHRYFTAGKRGDHISPRARGIDDNVTADFPYFTGCLIGGFNADATAVGFNNFCNFMAGEDKPVTKLRSPDIKHAQAKRINGTIGNFDCFFQFGIKIGNQIESSG